MKAIALLQMVALVVRTLAVSLPELPLTMPCGVPFSVRNSTRHVLAAMHSSDIDPGALGAADLFGMEAEYGPKPWPRGSDKLITIPYCYRTEVDRKQLKGRVDGAIKIWEDALGGGASIQSGHGLVFKEATKDGQVMYCSKEGAMFDWNEEIAYETVYFQVHDSPIAFASATIGLVSNPEDPEPWEMFLKVGKWADNAVVAHELGHVMGLAHEHQNRDRDNFVKYTCSNLDDYDRILRQAKSEDSSITADKLCNYFYTAFKYNFQGREFIKGISIGAWGKGWPVRHATQGYDYDSIMHYSTFVSSKIGCATNQLDKCVLVRYKNGKSRPWELKAIPRNMVPSASDLEWVRFFYPWKD